MCSVNYRYNFQVILYFLVDLIANNVTALINVEYEIVKLFFKWLRRVIASLLLLGKYLW